MGASDYFRNISYHIFVNTASKENKNLQTCHTYTATLFKHTINIYVGAPGFLLSAYTMYMLDTPKVRSI